MSEPGPPIISLDQAAVWQTNGEAAFRDLNWTIREGETWTVVGPVGAGKSTLFEALAGRLRCVGIAWPLMEMLRAAGRPADSPRQVIERVAFKEESRLFSYQRHYYQQRFNFIEPEDDLTLDAFLRARSAADDNEIQAVCARLGVDSLRDMSLINLSNGQIRRARIARALLGRPEVLLLDEPFMGLDNAGRVEVSTILGELVRQGQRVALITRREAIPEWSTHVLELGRLAVRWAGRRDDFLAGAAGSVGVLAGAAGSRDVLAGAAGSAGMAGMGGEPIIEMRNVTVAYGDRIILKNIDWTVRRGERWAVLGPNGSGKSTLLSLIAADHPQAYGNDVFIFGRRRGGGETIWEIKRDIGLISPEIHLYFTEPLSAFRAAATGFFDVLAYRPTTPAQAAVIQRFFDFFEIAPLANRPFAALSTGEQRLILLIRALVKSPPVLILDEPFQGLDSRYVTLLRDWLDRQLRLEQTLIFVSHLADEIPRVVNRRLYLQNGQRQQSRAD